MHLGASAGVAQEDGRNIIYFCFLDFPAPMLAFIYFMRRVRSSLSLVDFRVKKIVKSRIFRIPLLRTVHGVRGKPSSPRIEVSEGFEVHQLNHRGGATGDGARNHTFIAVYYGC